MTIVNGLSVLYVPEAGVVNAASGKPATMKKIAASIHAATGGHVDVLVITHEHFDHVCGFKFAEQELRKITFGQAWLAWTQDPTDTLAKSLHEEYGQQLEALRARGVGPGSIVAVATKRVVARLGMGTLALPARSRVPSILS